jgi:hypothetical protein
MGDVSKEERKLLKKIMVGNRFCEMIIEEGYG